MSSAVQRTGRPRQRARTEKSGETLYWGDLAKLTVQGDRHAKAASACVSPSHLEYSSARSRLGNYPLLNVYCAKETGDQNGSQTPEPSLPPLHCPASQPSPDSLSLLLVPVLELERTLSHHRAGCGSARRLCNDRDVLSLQ
ncbi:ELKS/Rab6-interacting/CAST family member 1 [Manis javanica]|nr:ELKS/Rab6-interacting/CAST family member 1 [Manis javanica]